MDIAGIRLRGTCKVLHYDCTGVPLSRGDFAVVPTERGPVLGEVVKRLDDHPMQSDCAPIARVTRPASADDLRSHQENGKKEQESHDICKKKIEVHKLPMKLVRTELLLDRSKTIFYFTADGRIDFRDLVKDLARDLRTRIEMRQIGVRDEARVLGGCGPCGRGLCCSTFLIDFEPVTVKMAKDQRLSLNPAKLSGVCGRLMCCIVYEHEAYSKEKAKKRDEAKAAMGKAIGSAPPPSVTPQNATPEESDAEMAQDFGDGE